ncbi:MAG: Penicillin-binding protein, 1A family [Parcubacteria group bacterium GW2011_GWA2_39_18]|nr:MAG: Penicillin-binding protein, 1A family [Parcubacteria group bacterium GW2011_GWA2_39_18]
MNILKKIKRSVFGSKNIFFVLFLFLVTICLISALMFLLYLIKTLPDPAQISSRAITQSTKIYDRTGKTLLYDVHNEEKRTVINSEDISQFLKDAVVAAEDDSFYNHSGISISSIARAAFSDLANKNMGQGGSTITQQLVKNAFLSPEKTFIRKIKEAFLAIQIEKRFSKEEILTMYLNQVPFGSNSYGAEAASLTFFNKHAKNLNLNEATLLASLIKAPSYFSPYGTHTQELFSRKDYILNRMEKLNFVNEKQKSKALSKKIEFAQPTESLLAPHFVLEIKNQLEKMFGASQVDQLGLKVYTTLDYNLQKNAEKIVLEGAQKNESVYNAFNAAMVAENPKTGEILALVGSRNYFAPPLPLNCISGKSCKFEGNFNVATQGLRQPGSSFKPLAYAQAFIKGYTPTTILFDVPINFAEPGATPYMPKNYDLRFRGPVTMRSSLAQSLNVPSVEALYLAGVNNTIKLANDFGISTINTESQCGLSLVLGGCEVKLIEMVQAYGVFANEGVGMPYFMIQKIVDSKNQTIFEYNASSQKIIEPQIAREITDILSDNAARAPMFGTNSYLYFQDIPLAAKTGTTDNNRDAWLVGYTPEVVVGVWAGNNNGDSMTKEGAGISAAGPIFHKIMLSALENIPHTSFSSPDTVLSTKPILNGVATQQSSVLIDKRTGKIADENTPPDQTEERTVSEMHNTLYYVQKDDPQGPSPINPRLDPQFDNWEGGLNEWLRGR